VAEYHVENFGCRASRADGEALGAELQRLGLGPASDLGTADVIVANTCSVTAQADRTARAFIRRAHRENPKARILVTGCYAQRAPEEVARLAGVHAVVGNSHKALLADMAQRAAAFVPITTLLADDAFAHADLAMPEGGWGAHAGHTRPNLKIQDGCGNRCSFCIIPTTRGHSRSMPLDDVLRHVRAFAAEGGTELVLSGINLGRWGTDLAPRSTFAALVTAILEHTALPRLRLSSIEPMDWTAELLALFAGSDRLARHAHVPLQSGSDRILRAMHRRYRPWHYAEKLERIREIMPESSIGADIMVGFPGETDELFEESFMFIAAQPFTYLHLFPFSPRPGTAAWQAAQDCPVPRKVVEARMARLRNHIAERNLHFRQHFIGRIMPAVTLRPSPGSYGLALTDNFLEVELYLDNKLENARTAPVVANQNVQILVTGLSDRGLTGHLAV
jgi:threonylcarbamoyladenosine tRNA methylthiotransferase MtaB